MNAILCYLNCRGKLGGLEILELVLGEQGLNCILLYGLGQTSSSWNETIQTLNKDWNIFCPDLSDWILGKQPCYDTLYKAFEKYCEQFDDTLCLVGLSLGGILAMQYSIEHSEKVKSLVLIGTQYKMPKRLLKLQNVLFHLMPDSEFSKMGFQKSDFISLCKSMMDLDFSHHLKDIRCKVLVVCGEKDKANKSASLQLAELIPDAEFITISGAGHEVNIDCPSELSENLNNFFK